MVGFGTVFNAGMILLGGLAGMLGGRLLTTRLQDAIMKASAISIMFIGIAGALEQMLRIEGISVQSGGSGRILISLVLGCIIGETINIEQRMNDFGCWLKAKTANEGDNSFVDAFVSATLTVCIGAMAVVGSIQDGVNGDWTILALKGALDAVLVCIFTSSIGKGAIFSVIPVIVFQGSITLGAHALEPLLTQTALDAISMLGSILIFCVGTNLIWPKTFRVANLLPSLILASCLAYI
ncbi:DUF554 domain-containing protein [Collinsella sp. zg1085]|uniref:DUF554 domain-containing protein n=1 Tax=Collinsella sp. zg1085 TaxID=2844380 RepID=UPI001C0AD163|nr:DUF554 domain-containing protein [Collinsella sp. zg1085]QWT17910.1 DUF554 domain-containing protein [Collinsella sp. zg1085]